MLWPRRSFARSFAYYRHRVLRLAASPHAIAAGVAAGAFASCTPLLGFHIIMALALAWLVGGSLLAAAFGTALGNPLTFPFIWAASFALGSFLLEGNAVAVTPGPAAPGIAPTEPEILARTLEPLLLGGALLGVVAAAATYLLVHKAVSASQAFRRARLTMAAEAATARRRFPGKAASIVRPSVEAE